MPKISQYTNAIKAKLADLFVVAQTDNGVTTTKSVTTSQIGDTVATEQTFAGLSTTDKTLVGGINEALGSGGVDELGELTDVTITSASAGESLRTDGNGAWFNQKTTNPMNKQTFDGLSNYNAYKNSYIIVTDAPNLNPTANDIGYDASASYDSGSVGKALQDIGVPSNTDITFTLKSGAKFTVTAFVGKRAGIVNILNLKLTPTEATAVGTEIEVGTFANIYTYGSGTYYTGVVVDDQTKLVGSYLMTLGNQKLYLKFTESTTRAIALTLVVFSA